MFTVKKDVEFSHWVNKLYGINISYKEAVNRTNFFGNSFRS